MKKSKVFEVLGFVFLGISIIFMSMGMVTNDKDVRLLSEENTVLIEELARAEYEVDCLRETTKVEDMGTFRVTYYCNDCDECGTNNVTSEGTRLTETIQSVAVDTSIIPAGSVIVMDGKLYIANDVGGAIKGRRIDVMVYGKPHEEVYAMGVDYFRVWVVN